MKNSVLENLPSGAKVAVIRLRSLGDCVLTTPALDILRRFRPDLHVAVMVEERFREIFDNALSPGLGPLRRFRPHLCLNLHGGPRSAWLTALSGARWRAGFAHFRNQFAYNVRIPRAQEILSISRKVHTAEHLASAMFYLGAPRVEVGPGRLPCSRAAARHAALAVLHPFATHPSKAWPAEGFAEVANRLGASGLEVVIIGGAVDDFSPFRAFRTLEGAPLSEIQSLLSTAALFLGNDSGPAHMAAAFAVPSVVLFGASDPEIWGPWRAPAQVLTAPGGIRAIRTAQVVAALTRLGVAA